MRVDSAVAIVSAIAARTSELISTLTNTSDEALRGPSLLPTWSRTTIICHLRYGAETTRAMTVNALAGREAAYYPDGRSIQRPSTLNLRPHESPLEAVESFTVESTRLNALFETLDDDDWQIPVHEPADNRDLGTTTLGLLALLRLTEVEVHGTDLDIGARPWGTTFIDAALPLRIQWLPTRQSNHGSIEDAVHGTWVIRPTDGSPYAVRSTLDGVTVEEETTTRGDAAITGSKRDLLAFLLGRAGLGDLSVSGDRELAAAFHQTFPPP